MKPSNTISHALVAAIALSIVVGVSGCSLLETPAAKSLISQAPQEVQDAAALASQIPEPVGCVELPLGIRFGCEARDVWHEFNDAALDLHSVRQAYLSAYLPMLIGKTDTTEVGTVARFHDVVVVNYGNIRDGNLSCFKDVILRQMTVNSISDTGLKTLSVFKVIAGQVEGDMMSSAEDVIAKATEQVAKGTNTDLLDGTQVAAQIIPADATAGLIAACGAIQ